MGKPKPNGPLVHLFDGHVYIFRAYYSLPPMKASDGTPCNAAYGFANTLIRYMAEEDPSHVGVCFDAAMTSFRNEVEPEYKAQRGETPDDLEPQFDLCHEISIALGFATYEVDNYEADDLLATICREVISRKGRTRVVTTDKDLCQLVREDGRTVVYDLAKEKIYDADGVREKFGVSPDQIQTISVLSAIRLTIFRACLVSGRSQRQRCSAFFRPSKRSRTTSANGPM